MFGISNKKINEEEKITIIPPRLYEQIFCIEKDSEDRKSGECWKYQTLARKFTGPVDELIQSIPESKNKNAIPAFFYDQLIAMPELHRLLRTGYTRVHLCVILEKNIRP